METTVNNLCFVGLLLALLVAALAGEPRQAALIVLLLALLQFSFSLFPSPPPLLLLEHGVMASPPVGEPSPVQAEVAPVPVSPQLPLEPERGHE
jgi:uncharacterized protein (DUF58 family)